MFEINESRTDQVTEVRSAPVVSALVTEKMKCCAKIKVIGVGGAGGNVVNTMIATGVHNVEYVMANTDMQALNAGLADIKIQIGREITKGLGAGADPEVGRKAALEEYERLSEVLKDADMVFITAGMGGGTGTGAAPVVAKLAKELGALTVGVVTKPFVFEGKKRSRVAENGIRELEESVDSLIIIPNQRLLYIAGETLSLVETFKKADEVLLNAVQGISDLINTTGLINADFADVRTVMSNKGLALMGTGLCSGENRAVRAASDAIRSPLLEDVTIDGATGIIINVTGSSSLTTHETNEAVSLIMEAADDDAEIIFGTGIDEALGDRIKVTVIATGLGERYREVKDRRATSIQTVMPQVAIASPVVAPVQIQAPTLGQLPTPQVAERARSVTPVMPAAPQVVEERKVVAVDPELNTTAAPIAASMASAESNESLQKLQDSIREVAKNFNNFNFTPPAPDPERENLLKSKQREEEEDGIKRARSIAEKLGFINFDDHELDTPTFLRRNNDSASISNQPSL